MQRAKTVVGMYIFEDGKIIDKDAFDADTAGDAISTKHPLEAEYADAVVTVPSTEQLAAFSGLTKNEIYARQIAVAQQRTHQQIQNAGTRDQLLVQAVRALDDINEQNNELSERLRPWYRLHFPELVDEVSDNDEFARMIAEQPDREQREEFKALERESTGMPFTKEDIRALQAFAAHLSDGYDVREELEAYVDRLASEVAPNLTAILGGVLAARIISLAGSLEQLAMKPSSTIQVLGAEKAMFRHLEEGSSAPKYGVLYQHEYVQKAPHDRAGEISRFIANKAAIAARIDHFAGEYRGDSLRAEVDEKFRDISSA